MIARNASARLRPGSLFRRPRYPLAGSLVRVTPTSTAKNSFNASTGQSLPKAMRAPASCRRPSGSMRAKRAGPMNTFAASIESGPGLPHWNDITGVTPSALKRP